MSSITGFMTRIEAKRQRAGGAAALYLALALLTAIPYFLLAVDYPGASTTADKVSLVIDNYPSMYLTYLATYVAFGIALGVLALALWARLEAAAPLPRPVRARATTGAERDRLWQRWRDVDDGLDGFAGLRSVETPVVVLEPRAAERSTR